MAAMMVNKEPTLDGVIFFIVNKKYNHAKLAQSGKNDGDIGTYELRRNIDQLWRLEADPGRPQRYYINNVKHDGFRLAKYGRGDSCICCYNKNYNIDQLWHFVKHGDYFRIYNVKHPEAKLAKYGKRDSDLCTFEGRDVDDQLWKLVPFIDVVLEKRILWHVDNRQGKRDVTLELCLTHGMKLTKKSPIAKVSNSVKFSAAVEISKLVKVGEGSLQHITELESQIGSDIEKESTEVRKETFTAPAGINFRVWQWQIEFNSLLAEVDVGGTVYTNNVQTEVIP
ncbi:uncharacterized protein LOC135155505 [Lytechinus pictus]|uniref:uncharacterized protein LOC135155505 n=1 Tax=Lytechinus pictus TaxID=7653 RepID=UPI0030B9EE65